MAGNLWNNSWLCNYRLGSCTDLLLRNIAWLSNKKEAGSVAFNGYYFGAASTGSLSGNAVVSFTQRGSLGSTGQANTRQHLWNNSWLFNHKLGATQDFVLRQISWLPNTQESGALAFNAYYFGVQQALISGAATIAFTEAGTLLGTGVLAGTTTIVVTEAGTLSGTGPLAGAASVAFDESGSLVGFGSLQATSAVLFIESGSLDGLGHLVATTSIVFTESGNIGEVVVGPLNGTTAIVFVGIGDLSGFAPIVIAEDLPVCALSNVADLRAGVFVTMSDIRSTPLSSVVELTYTLRTP